MSKSSRCVDCGVDTCPEPNKRDGRTVRNGRVGRWEHYMVHPKIWKTARLAPDDGYLCARDISRLYRSEAVLLGC